MTMPAINLNFARAPGIIDPRATFTRATTATYISSTGLIKTAPANAARFQYDPTTLACRGYLSEPQRTNLFLRSQEFDNASWTKNNLTVTANSATAPDGTATADTLAGTGSDASVIQAVTITAGRGTAASIYLKANASAWAYMIISDGTNVVAQWFNLAAGTKGTQSGGAGTNTFAQATIESMGRGWYRCSLETITSTVTAISVAVYPCAADLTNGGSGNSMYAWGAQFEADSATNSPTSYIPTTSATVTRNADNLIFTGITPWFNDRAGTLVIDTVNILTPPTFSVSQPMYGGFGDSGAFVDVIYLYRVSATGVRVSAGSASGGSGGLVDRTTSWAVGGSNKIGVAWALDDLAMVVNGGAPAADSSFTLPVATNLVRMVIGGAPWSAISATSIGSTIYRSWQYYPARLSNADLQALTAT